MATREFPHTEPIELQVKITAGTVRIDARPTDAVRLSLEPTGPGRDAADVLDDLLVDFSDGVLRIVEPDSMSLRRRPAGIDVLVTIPQGSRCVVHTASADVSCEGQPGSLDIRTASGNVSAQAVSAESTITTASGDVSIGSATGTVTVQTASGGIRIGEASADVTATSASGGIRIGGAAASVKAKTASGEIHVAGVAHGRVDADSVSGDVTVLVARGTGVYLDLASLSGRVTSELEPSPEPGENIDLCVTCHTMSGDVRVARVSREIIAPITS